MKRSGGLARSWFRPRKKRADEPQAQGRPSATRAEWEIRKQELAVRSGGRCEVRAVVFKAPGEIGWPGWFRCSRRAVDPCHIVSRARGGSDALENLFHGCRSCHRRQDVPFRDGKLIPLGLASDGKPLFKIVYAADKVEARGADGVGQNR